MLSRFLLDLPYPLKVQPGTPLHLSRRIITSTRSYALALLRSKASHSLTQYQTLAKGLPAGYSMRPIMLQDAPAIVAMLNADAIEHAAEPLFSVSEYEVDLQSPLLDLERQTRIITGPDGIVAAVGEFHTRSPHVRPHLWVRTALQARGRGFGSRLLEWGLDMAQAGLVDAPDQARVTLSANTLSTNTEAALLLEAHGFNHVRDFLQMGIFLQGPPPSPRWPEGISVRTFRLHEDDAALFLAQDDAFADHWGHLKRASKEYFHAWQERLHNNPLFDPTLYFLALDGEEIAGFSLCLAPVPGELQSGWVNLLGVRRPWRKHGLGHALLLHSFGEFYRRGVNTVGLGVDAESPTGATRLYERAGMSIQHVTAVYELELRPGTDLTTA